MQEVLKLLTNRMFDGQPGTYLRLVLAEAARCGMDVHTVSLLDDVAAMLGFYNALPANQAAHLAGPVVNWRSHPDQPTHDRVVEVEKLAYQQRALIAFGGAPAGQFVGTAEIVLAAGNLHPKFAPSEYYEVFTWASVDVLSTLLEEPPEAILKQKGKEDWKHIPDDDVIKPGGRLYATYQEIATTIRRESMNRMLARPDNPRTMLRPVAAHFIEAHEKVRTNAQAENLPDVVERLDIITGRIRAMYPDIGSLEDEMEKHNEASRQALAGLGPYFVEPDVDFS